MEGQCKGQHMGLNISFSCIKGQMTQMNKYILRKETWWSVDNVVKQLKTAQICKGRSSILKFAQL